MECPAGAQFVPGAIGSVSGIMTYYARQVVSVGVGVGPEAPDGVDVGNGPFGGKAVRPGAHRWELARFAREFPS